MALVALIWIRLKHGFYDAIVAASIILVIFVIEMVIELLHTFESPQTFARIIIELLRD